MNEKFVSRMFEIYVSEFIQREILLLTRRIDHKKIWELLFLSHLIDQTMRTWHTIVKKK